jgi:integrase
MWTWKGAILSVRHTLQRYGGAYHLDEPKTERSRRKIPLTAGLVGALRAHRTHQLEECLRAGSEWTGDDWRLVFATERGEPLLGCLLTRHFQGALKAAGLPDQPFHNLRHAAASFMLSEGVGLRIVMEVLGHSEIAVTANVYGHVMFEGQRDALDRVGALLEKHS